MKKDNWIKLFAVSFAIVGGFGSLIVGGWNQIFKLAYPWDYNFAIAAYCAISVFLIATFFFALGSILEQLQKITSHLTQDKAENETPENENDSRSHTA